MSIVVSRTSWLVLISAGVSCVLSANGAVRFLSPPFLDPNMVLTQGWMYDNAKSHHGIDYAIGSPSVSFSVLAAASGKAVVVLVLTVTQFKHIL